jgi:flagellar protein FliO/FliZ
MEPFVSNFARMLAALALVLALAWIALRVLRGRLGSRGTVRLPGAAASGEALRFVRALPVGTKERVVLVEHRGERWLLGVTAGGISTIAHWSASAGEARSEGPVEAEKALPGGPSDWERS